MGFFSIKKKDDNFENLSRVLHTSFDTVKHDILKLSEWLKYLYQRNIEQDKLIAELQRQMHYIPKNKEELRDLIDQYYSLDPLKHKVDKISQKIEIFEESHNEIIALKYALEELKIKISSSESSGNQVSHLIHKLDDIKSKISQLEEVQIPLKRHVEEHQEHQYEQQRMVVERSQPVSQVQSVSTVNNLREKILRKIIKSSKDHVKNLIKNLIIKYGQISALHLREIIVEEQGLCSKSSFYRILEELETDEDISVMHDKKEKKLSYNNIKYQKS